MLLGKIKQNCYDYYVILSKGCEFMLGILAEKPDQARAFAKALGGMEGEYNGEKYIIANSVGHVYEYTDPEKMVSVKDAKQFKSWDSQYLPWQWRKMNFSYRKKKGKSKVINEIKKRFKDVDEIAIATDDDPTGEGEKLAWEIISENNLANRKISRMYFADDMPKNVQKAFKNRVYKKSMHDDPDMTEAELRARWDWLSLQWTRLASLAVKNKAVLRQGRLKTSMVVLVGQQFNAIKHYKKIPAYSQRYKDDNGNIFIDKNAQMFKTKADVKLDAPSKVKVTSKKLMHKAPPALYDLTKLTIALGRDGISAKTVLATYQKMYQDHVVTYPRTEDKKITAEQFKDGLKYAGKIADLVGVDKAKLTHTAMRKTHVGQGMTHGANRPWDNVPSSLDDLDKKYGKGAKKIYVILAKNFLAMFGEDYEYNHVTAELVNHSQYKAIINQPVKLGYKEIFMDEAPDNDKDFGMNATSFVCETFPPKPVKPTAKWLFTCLEKYHVGTGATQSSTYGDVTDTRSKYPLLQDKAGKITLTEYGEWSYEIMQGTNLAKVETTAQLNDNMKLLRQEKANWDDLYKWLDEETELIKQDKEIISQNGIAFCKKRGITDMDNDKITGKWTDENGQEFDVNFKDSWRGHKWSKSESDALLKGESVKVTLTSKSGKPYEMIAKLGHQEFTNSEGKTIKGIWVDGKFAPRKASVPDEFCKHKFTEDEKAALENGEEIAIDDFVSKKGNKFSAKVKFGDKEWNGKKTKGLILSFD